MTEGRARFFKRCLEAAGYHVIWKPKKTVVPWATISGLPLEVGGSLLTLFRELGGVPEYASALAPQGWDLQADGVLIELDEDLHFNRYRSLSLDVPWASHLPWFRDYASYAEEKEDMCLRAGRYQGKWASPSSDRMFGGSDPEGVLGELGASRWKQRAIYDTIKDAHALQTPGVALARVAIHDDIGGLNINKAAKKNVLLDPAILRAYVDARTIPKTDGFQTPPPSVHGKH